jgi:uncharacterized 2Fe-2S/4Fe-4S cluster protein (DUF4445 family)
VLALLPEKVRQANGSVLVFYYAEHTIAKIVDMIPLSDPSDATPFFGIAVDIGTTTVALALTCLDDGKILSVQNNYNSQVECGLDVISRINYAKKNLAELQTRIIKTINDLIAAACKETGVAPVNIRCASLAGNTTMTHLLLGIAPEYIRLSPYTPAVFQPQCYIAGDIGISMCKNAPILFAPAVGSYVGGDITAGMLCTALAANNAQQDKNANPLVLFIDIGTNGEIVLGNREFIFACACSAGPAFEGGGIKHGIRAQTGAIEKLIINENGKPEIRTIGNAPPIGICGSGVISTIAELFRKNIIDSAGKFPQKNGEYKLCDGISINETDIDNFIRAKGAIFSACQTMLDSVNMSFSDIDLFYVAGGFGRFLDLDDSRTIGLLPNIANESIIFLGNSSCFGAYLALVSQAHRTKLRDLAQAITYIDLSSDPTYMDHYTGALFLPHTDKSLF